MNDQDSVTTPSGSDGTADLLESLKKEVETLQQKVEQQQESIRRLNIATQVLSAQRNQAMDAVVNLQIEAANPRNDKPQSDG